LARAKKKFSTPLPLAHSQRGNMPQHSGSCTTDELEREVTAIFQSIIERSLRVSQSSSSSNSSGNDGNDKTASRRCAPSISGIGLKKRPEPASSNLKSTDLRLINELFRRYLRIVNKNSRSQTSLEQKITQIKSQNAKLLQENQKLKEYLSKCGLKLPLQSLENFENSESQKAEIKHNLVNNDEISSKENHLHNQQIIMYNSNDLQNKNNNFPKLDSLEITNNKHDSNLLKNHSLDIDNGMNNITDKSNDQSNLIDSQSINSLKSMGSNFRSPSSMNRKFKLQKSMVNSVMSEKLATIAKQTKKLSIKDIEF